MAPGNLFAFADSNQPPYLVLFQEGKNSNLIRQIYSFVWNLI
jgi:hypothetical protein